MALRTAYGGYTSPLRLRGGAEPAPLCAAVARGFWHRLEGKKRERSALLSGNGEETRCIYLTTPYFSFKGAFSRLFKQF